MRTVNRQRFASWIGVIIVTVHIFLTAAIWFIFLPNVDEPIEIGKIALPLTVSLGVSVISWFIETKGVITSDDQLGWSFVIVICLVVFSFLGSLPLGIYLYWEGVFGTEQLNEYYVSMESLLGGMFILIFNFMFERPQPNPQ